MHLLLRREAGGGACAGRVAPSRLMSHFLNDDGVTHIVKAGPNFEAIAQNELGEKTYASPAISGRRLFLRSFTSLYCIPNPPSFHASVP
jgi:hypothetical protein